MSALPISYRVHAVQRMFERGIQPASVRRALQVTDILEDYSDESRQPGHLLFGVQSGRPFHLVTCGAPRTASLVIVTVYLPHPSRWKRDARTRR